MSGDAIAVREAVPPARLRATLRGNLRVLTVIGHIDGQFTLPLGAGAEIDAAAGTIRVVAPAVR